MYEGKMFRRSLEVKFSTICTDGRAEVRRVREEKRKREKKEDAGARKGRKVAIHSVFHMIYGSGDSRKVGSLKRRVRSHVAR